jgi:DNA-binding IclR family transcriptional regulator
MSTTAQMVNEDYTPSDNEKQILNVITEGRSQDDPWGRVNPLYLRERTGMNKQQVNYALNQLRAAGWVQKVTDGLYEFVADPRG